MFRKLLLALFFLSLSFTFFSCAGIGKATNFPSPDDVFITTGDGDIQKPYTPIGQIMYMRGGARLSFLPFFGLIKIDDVDPDYELRTVIFKKIKEMGGDALINMDINWTPPSDGLLGWGANGGHVYITGTVIKR